jgi:hypothetical protein
MSLWTVEERAWKQELPDLPDDIIDLLADPVVVSALPEQTRAPSLETQKAADTVPV